MYLNLVCSYHGVHSFTTVYGRTLLRDYCVSVLHMCTYVHSCISVRVHTAVCRGEATSKPRARRGRVAGAGKRGGVLGAEGVARVVSDRLPTKYSSRYPGYPDIQLLCVCVHTATIER